MDVTIAICTRNRAAPLRRTLNSVAAMRIPNRVKWEVIVVDNGSRDDTEAVIKSFVGTLPISPHFEPTPGVSYARNRAVAAARGKYILWTDDDVIVDSNWLSSYLAAFERWPEVPLFGGKITALFEDPAPDWLDRSLNLTAVSSVFAIRDFGDHVIEITSESGPLPYGANYALRTAEHRAFPFRVDLGPGTGMNGEETEVFKSMLRAGKIGYWLPEAKVQHCIPPARMTLAYIDQYCAAYGRFIAHTEPIGTSTKLFGAPRWLWRRFFIAVARYAGSRVSSGPEYWMKARVDRAVIRGMIAYYREKNSDSRNI